MRPSRQETRRAVRTLDLSSLARLFVQISSLREPSAIAEIAVASLGDVLPIEMSQLLIVGEDGQLVESAHWCAAGSEWTPLPGEVVAALRARMDNSAIIDVFDPRSPSTPELAGQRLSSVALMPLRANAVDVGLLVATSRFAKEFDREQVELASLLAAHIAASLDAAIALDRERRSAHTDALTGLLNRRGLSERLERELADAHGLRQILSLVVFDWDDFKDVNDRAGHEFGDALLREVGLVLDRACPEGGAAARLGGDEFVVMLPATDADAALEETERIRAQLEAGLEAAGFPLHMSAGVATYPFDGAAATQLLRAADQALFRSKATGKNRVTAFSEISRASTATTAGGGNNEGGRATSSGASMLRRAMEVSAAIGNEDTIESLLDRLSKAVPFVVGATGIVVSRVEGARLIDTAKHSMRDISLGEEQFYEIASFPLTQEVLDKQCVRSISFLDADIDAAEAFVLRELQMNAVVLAPLVAHGRSWGLVEVYDMRLRRFTEEEEAVFAFLVCQAGRRLESLIEKPVS